MIDVNVIVARPVVWDLPALTDESGQPLGETPVHPGSVEGLCNACRKAVWVGPHSQAKLDELRGAGALVVLLCFECAARSRAAYGGPIEPIQVLGPLPDYDA